MAGVDTALSLPSERAQCAALFEMRWRLFLHNMRRDEEKVSFILWLIRRILIFGLAAGAGAVACFITYLAASRGQALAFVFNLTFVGWQLLNLFRSSMPQGVEAELYRFPLRFRTYVALWLSAGAFEGLTLLGTWVCVGIFAGLVLARRSVLLSAAVLLLFYAVNLLLTRSVFVWLGRMLASRRAREFVLIVSSSLSILPQVMRMQHERIAAWMGRLPLPAWFFGLLQWSPGALASRSIADGHLRDMSALALWAAAFAAVLLTGLRRSFRGDDVHEFRASASSVKTRRNTHRGSRDTSLAAAIAGCELARLRHGGSAIFATLSPLLYVVLFGLRLAHGTFGAWIIPVAAAYIGLGLRWVNVFGQDGAGVQLYLLSPVPLRTVLIGKNLFAALLYTVQVVLGAVILSMAMHRVNVVALAFTALWMVFFMSSAFSLGNYRSVVAPTFVSTDKVSMQNARRARRAGGGWMSLVLIFGSSGIGAAIIALCMWIHRTAWAPWMLVPFAVAGILVYRGSLEKEEFRGDTIVTTEPLLLRVARGA